MRLNGDGRYECVLCGTELDIPLTAQPQVMLEARSGYQNIRVLTLNGTEVHRCESRRVDSRELSGADRAPD
jgi:hypothetical protein